MYLIVPIHFPKPTPIAPPTTASATTTAPIAKIPTGVKVAKKAPAAYMPKPAPATQPAFLNKPSENRSTQAGQKSHLY